MSTPTFAEQRAALMADPEHRAAIEVEKARILRRYNRPWWRIVRWWDARR